GIGGVALLDPRGGQGEGVLLVVAGGARASVAAERRALELGLPAHGLRPGARRGAVCFAAAERGQGGGKEPLSHRLPPRAHTAPLANASPLRSAGGGTSAAASRARRSAVPASVVALTSPTGRVRRSAQPPRQRTGTPSPVWPAGSAYPIQAVIATQSAPPTSTLKSSVRRPAISICSACGRSESTRWRARRSSTSAGNVTAATRATSRPSSSRSRASPPSAAL